MSTWIVILGSGLDSKLAPLTRVLDGRELPTQLACLGESRSLLQTTVDLACTLAIPKRVVVVVSSRDEDIAREQLAPFPQIEIIVEPRWRDTAPALLLGLTRVLAREPFGRVVVLPADCAIASPSALRAALATADRTATRTRVTVLGVPAAQVDATHDWIVCGPPLDDETYQVHQLWQTPTVGIVSRLASLDAIWNTGISTGPVTAYWELARAHLPKHVPLLQYYADEIDRPWEWHRLHDAYARIGEASTADLFGAGRGLAVVPVDRLGWADWSSLRALIQSLEGTPRFAELLGRIRATRPPPFAKAS